MASSPPTSRKRKHAPTPADSRSAKARRVALQAREHDLSELLFSGAEHVVSALEPLSDADLLGDTFAAGDRDEHDAPDDGTTGGRAPAWVDDDDAAVQVDIVRVALSLSLVCVCVCVCVLNRALVFRHAVRPLAHQEAAQDRTRDRSLGRGLC